MATAKRLASARGVARERRSHWGLRASRRAMGLGVAIALFGCGLQDEFAESAVELPEVLEELRVEDLAIGDGPECQSPNEIVTIHYRGILLDGRLFDSSYERGVPIVAPLDSLIPGWQQGIPGMRVGGRRRLTVPSNLAYSGMAALQAVSSLGAEERAELLIPPKSTLIFEIELLAVTPREGPELPPDIARRPAE